VERTALVHHNCLASFQVDPGATTHHDSIKLEQGSIPLGVGRYRSGLQEAARIAPTPAVGGVDGKWVDVVTNIIKIAHGPVSKYRCPQCGQGLHGEILRNTIQRCQECRATTERVRPDTIETYEVGWSFSIDTVDVK